MQGWPVVVGIPVRNEAERIRECVLALDHQIGAPPPELVLFLNDTSDGSARIVQDLMPSLRMSVHVVEGRLPAEQQAAGFARCRAMDLAAKRAGPGGILLSTDADGRVVLNWLERNLAHLQSGVDAVAGRAVIDAVEAAAIPQRLHDDDAAECAYAAALDEVDHWIDPKLYDPWPRHTEHSGASICVRYEAFHRAGGIPAVSAGEDRAFFAALDGADARIRHAPDVSVTVSGRLVGRAAGGMADTIRRRIARPDPFLDDRLEPACDALQRTVWKRQLRQAIERGDGAVVSRLCARWGVSPPPGLSSFGPMWARLEGMASALQRRAVPAARVMVELAEVRAILEWLRAMQAEERLEGAVEYLEQGRRQAETGRVVIDQPAIL